MVKVVLHELVKLRALQFSFDISLVSISLFHVSMECLAQQKHMHKKSAGKEHQALGLSIVGMMWGIGLIIGPVLGGFFAQPQINFQIYKFWLSQVLGH